MSESKWVNRNVRSGRALQSGTDTSFTKGHVRKVAGPPKSGFGVWKPRRGKERTVHTFRRTALAVVVVGVLGAAAAKLYQSSRHLAASDNDPASEMQRMLARTPTPVPHPAPAPIASHPGHVVDKFLVAHSVADLTKLGRMDDNSQSLIREFGDQILDWNKGHLRWTELDQAKSNSLGFSAFEVEHSSQPKRLLCVVQTPFGPRVDVGAFLGWCSADWTSLATGKTTRATTVRATITRDTSYDRRFSDEKSWQCYRLAHLHGDTPLCAYATRDSNTHRALEFLLENHQPALAIVALDDGEAEAKEPQFRISRVLAAGWTSATEPFEDHFSPPTPATDDHPAPTPAQPSETN